MGKIVCFIYDEMADFEFTLACQIAKSYGNRQTVTAAYTESVRSRPGILYQRTLSVEAALALNDVDGLILPGGWVREQKPTLTDLIRKLHKEKKLIAAICAGPEFVARAGLLVDHRFTTTLTPEYFKEKAEPDPFPWRNWVDEGLVRDRNIITATDACFIDFAVEVADFLACFSSAEEKEIVRKIYKGF